MLSTLRANENRNSTQSSVPTPIAKSHNRSASRFREADYLRDSPLLRRSGKTLTPMTIFTAIKCPLFILTSFLS
ncbi:MAG: hypothetical protein HC769_18745 [Cyanobacteria bacterium CRU_2_1]|nr:hypothetical protein [Cyanobacteria bacterium CRU_2_1]